MLLAKARDYHQAELGRRGASAETVKNYGMVEGWYLDFLSECLGVGTPTVAALSPPNVRRFEDWLRASPGRATRFGGAAHLRSDDTITQYLSRLKYWASFLVKDGWLDADPLRGLRLARRAEKPVETFTPAQVDRMVALCAATRDPWRNRAILLFFYDTGVRVTELARLALDDIAFAGARTPGKARVVGKGRKERHVFFGGRTSQALTKYVHFERGRYGTPRAPAVFLTRDGGALTRGALGELVKDLGARAGIRGMRVSCHVLRHTFAVGYLRRNPGQVEQLRHLLGHAQLGQVLHYARLAEVDVENTYTSLADELGRRTDRDRD